MCSKKSIFVIIPPCPRIQKVNCTKILHYYSSWRFLLITYDGALRDRRTKSSLHKIVALPFVHEKILDLLPLLLHLQDLKLWMLLYKFKWYLGPGSTWILFTFPSILSFQHIVIFMLGIRKDELLCSVANLVFLNSCSLESESPTWSSGNI